MNNWIPKSTQPTEPGAYLVFMPKRDIDRYSVHWWHPIDKWEFDVGITHWMHLPEPPANAIGRA